ncbi:MAG: NOP5/NOP56 family protein [Candidatus Diapherotrites archaeon]|nr:NOP5/NOP56 family protein [Candidatus Diapherotrites archaeon]
MPEIEQLRKALIRKTREQVKERYGEREVHVIRAASVLQDLDPAFNLLAEQAIEWYGAHFPELQRIVKDNERFLQLVSKLGERKNFTKEKAGEIAGEKAGEIADAAGKSMGSELGADTMVELRALASNALSLRQERVALEKFIDKEMRRIAPNFAEVAGPLIGAKMLAESGSLQHLAMQPASTLQLLGAKKALFRHMKNKSIKGPKYGFIYQHPLLHKVALKNRGKMARSLGAKLCIAVRTDFFGSRKKIGEELLRALEERAKQLK